MSTIHDDLDTRARDAEAVYRRAYHHCLCDILALLDQGVSVVALRRHERAVRRWREATRRADRAGGFEPPPPLTGGND